MWRISTLEFLINAYTWLTFRQIFHWFTLICYYITVNRKACRVNMLFNTLHVYLSYTFIRNTRVSIQLNKNLYVLTKWISFENWFLKWPLAFEWIMLAETAESKLWETRGNWSQYKHNYNLENNREIEFLITLTKSQRAALGIIHKRFWKQKIEKGCKSTLYKVIYNC